jgi:hypothetical protein
MNKNIFTGKRFKVRRHKRMHVRQCRNQTAANGTKWAGFETYIDSNKVLPEVCTILAENHDKVLVRGKGSFYWFKSFYLGEEVKADEVQTACETVERLARSIGKDCQIIFTKDGVSIAPLSAGGDTWGPDLYQTLKEAMESSENE